MLGIIAQLGIPLLIPLLKLKNLNKIFKIISKWKNHFQEFFKNYLI